MKEVLYQDHDSLFLSAFLSTIWWFCGVVERDTDRVRRLLCWTELYAHGAVWPWASLSHSLDHNFPGWTTRVWRSFPVLLLSDSTNIWNSLMGPHRKRKIWEESLEALANTDWMTSRTTETEVWGNSSEHSLSPHQIYASLPEWKQKKELNIHFSPKASGYLPSAAGYG